MNWVGYNGRLFLKYLDIVVIGGGFLGLVFVYGLSGDGGCVGLIDEGDYVICMVCGNFGLVWV